MAVTVLVLSVIIYGFLKFFGLNLDGFWKSIEHNLQFNAHINRKDAFSWLSFMYILWRLEGLSIFAVFVYILLSSKIREKALFPLLVIFLHLLVFTFASLNVPRVLVVLTPYFAMCYGLVFYDIYKRCEQNQVSRIISFIIIFVILFSCMWNAKKIVTFKSSLNEAIALIQEKDSQAGIISTNKFNTLYYSNTRNVQQIDFRYTISDLQTAYKNGYYYLLLDQVKHIACSYDGDYNNTMLTPLFFHIENICPKFAKVSHSNSDLMSWAAMEGNQRLARTVYFIDNLKKNSGDIHIYSLGKCLDVLKGKK